jgi:hypothetical protein
MIHLTEYSVGKFFHTFKGDRVEVIKKHPRKDYYQVHRSNCDPAYFVTAQGDYDLSGNAKPSDHDLVNETGNQIIVELNVTKGERQFTVCEETKEYYYVSIHLGRKPKNDYDMCCIPKKTMKVHLCEDKSVVGSARLP